LNIIGNRFDRNSYEVWGDISFGADSIRQIGYVAQSNFLLPYLTVEETLIFNAHLKLFPNDPEVQLRGYDGIVQTVLSELGLQDCATTIIGDGESGISGGEKRRVSIACQILSRPSMLCADEPTSGLDAFTAATVPLVPDFCRHYPIFYLFYFYYGVINLMLR
jgi:ABC-type multidrug transport system ATPase subunit